MKCDILNMENYVMTPNILSKNADKNTSYLFNANADYNASYHLRLATPEDAYEIWSVMNSCYQTIEHKEYFIYLWWCFPGTGRHH